MADRSVEKTRYPGIYRVHQRGCAHKAGKGCRCPRNYQAAVFDARARKLIRKNFTDLGAARTWREDTAGAIRSGKLRAPTSTTVAQAAEVLVAGMRDGSVLDRSGKPYKPATTRGYARSLRLRVLPAFGDRRLSELVRRDVQRFVDQLRAEGCAPSTIQNTLNPLQVICRRAVRDDEMAVDPTDGLELPAVRGRRERIAGPAEAARLIAALPESERALWATAFYAGLRRGELRALRWSDVDLDGGVIHVCRGWDDDPEVGEIEVKSDAGRRRVPLVGVLRELMTTHRETTSRDGNDLVFGRTAELPFIPTTIRRRALSSWKRANKRIAEEAERAGRDVAPEELHESLTPHEARHCAASYLIAAGLNPKELSVYIGHSDVRTTFNRYGHLMPGGEKEAVAKLDAFFGGATGGKRPAPHTL
jgi:integrase